MTSQLLADNQVFHESENIGAKKIPTSKSLNLRGELKTLYCSVSIQQQVAAIELPRKFSFLFLSFRVCGAFGNSLSCPLDSHPEVKAKLATYRLKGGHCTRKTTSNCNIASLRCWVPSIFVSFSFSRSKSTGCFDWKREMCRWTRKFLARYARGSKIKMKIM